MGYFKIEKQILYLYLWDRCILSIDIAFCDGDNQGIRTEFAIACAAQWFAARYVDGE
jgi:hypothetical protein